MKKIITLLLVLIAFSAAEYPAPAGFKWGTAPDKKCRQTQLTQIKDVILCTTTNVSKPIPWVDEYYLLYYKNKLIKVLMNSKSTRDDVTGSTNRELYEKIKETLTSKYGEPETSYETSGRKLYEEYDEFFECLAYTGCGAYLSVWTNQENRSTMSLEIKSLGSRGRGYVQIAYESIAFQKFTEDKKALEDQATNEGL
jgi:hypothetical protein